MEMMQRAASMAAHADEYRTPANPGAAAMCASSTAAASCNRNHPIKPGAHTAVETATEAGITTQRHWERAGGQQQAGAPPVSREHLRQQAVEFDRTDDSGSDLALGECGLPDPAQHHRAQDASPAACLRQPARLQSCSIAVVASRGAGPLLCSGR